MTGDVFYQEIKSVDSPRGSVVPEGATTEEIDGQNILRIPAATTRVDTPIIFPGFRIIVEGDQLHVSGDTIVDAAIYGETLEAQNAVVTSDKEIEVVGLMQAVQVSGKTVRADRIEAERVQAVLNIRATGAVIAKSIIITDGGIRAPLLVTQSLDGEDLADSSKTWTDGIAAGDVPDWLQGGA
ncbi:MAG: hypothetical protein OXR64_15320 [Chloroflexota bacterium]|nr:hypothetical protein [Chloroflexota bacterium]MDE2921206.1 hypothetical protein [Chloroflexota bacterium]